MDSYCTEQFALHATQEEISQLEDCLKKMIETRNSPEDYNYFSNEFHLLIAKGSKNHFIVKVIEYLRDNMLVHQNVLSQDLRKTKYQIGISYHYKILQAIKRHDAELAGAYCRYHIRLSMDLYRKANNSNTEKALI